MTPPPARARARGKDARLAALVRRAVAIADLGAPEPARAGVEGAAARLGDLGARTALAERLVAAALEAAPYRRAARAGRSLREVPVSGMVDGRLVEDVLDLVFDDGTGLVAVAIAVTPADEGVATRLAACCAALAATGRHVAEAYLLSLAPGGAEVTPVATPPALP